MKICVPFPARFTCSVIVKPFRWCECGRALEDSHLSTNDDTTTEKVMAGPRDNLPLKKACLWGSCQSAEKYLTSGTDFLTGVDRSRFAGFENG